MKELVKTPKISLKRIQRWQPCYDQYERVAQLYPDGVPLSRETALVLHEAGLDVIWGLVRLMTRRQRQEFILFTLRLRQPYLVTLFRRANHGEQAKDIAALRFENIGQAKAAGPILGAAGAVARVARVAGNAAGAVARAARVAEEVAAEAAWDAGEADENAAEAAWAAWEADENAAGAAWAARAAGDAAKLQCLEYACDLLSLS